MNKRETYDKVFELLHAAQHDTRRLGASYLSEGQVSVTEFTDYVLDRFFNGPLLNMKIFEDREDVDLDYNRVYETQIFLSLEYVEKLYVRQNKKIGPHSLYYSISALFYENGHPLAYSGNDMPFEFDLFRDFVSFVNSGLRGLVREIVLKIAAGDLETLYAEPHYYIPNKN